LIIRLINETDAAWSGDACLAMKNIQSINKENMSKQKRRN
jgi:hypothetical protein